MKLEKLNLTELDAQEVKSVEGGLVPIAIRAIIKGIGIGFGAAAAVYGAIALGKEIAD